MSIKVVIAMEIKDFDVWNGVFSNEHSQNARKEAGIDVEANQGLDNPNQVVLIGSAPSKETLMGFFSSPAQQKRMQNAGVQSKPTITFLKG